MTNPNRMMLWHENDLAVHFHGGPRTRRGIANSIDRYIALTLLTTITASSVALIAGLIELFGV